MKYNWLKTFQNLLFPVRFDACGQLLGQPAYPPPPTTSLFQARVQTVKSSKNVVEYIMYDISFIVYQLLPFVFLPMIFFTHPFNKEQPNFKSTISCTIWCNMDGQPDCPILSASLRLHPSSFPSPEWEIVKECSRVYNIWRSFYCIWQSKVKSLMLSCGKPRLTGETTIAKLLFPWRFERGSLIIFT